LTKTAARRVAANGLSLDDFEEGECGRRLLKAAVSDAQFEMYRRAGLIPAAVDGFYPPDTPKRLVCIHEMGTHARMLCRRVVRLRAEHLFWQIDSENLREAMVEFAPQVPAGKQKMVKVERALYAYGRFLSQGPAAAMLRGVPRRWHTPSQERWPGILQADPDLFALRSGPAYGMAINILPAVLRGTEFDLTSVPLEEQILLITVRDIAATLAMRDARRGMPLWRDQGESKAEEMAT
jgi:hypothetical protein